MQSTFLNTIFLPLLSVIDTKIAKIYASFLA